MARLGIVGQKHHLTSWSKVGRYLVKYLRRFGIDAEYIDMNYPVPDMPENLLFVPIEWTIGQFPEYARYVFKRARNLCGFVSTDSTQPGYVAIYLAKTMHVVLLTGEFAKQYWMQYIYDKYVGVVHLGIDEELYERPYNDNPSRVIKTVRRAGGVKVLVFHYHDTFRKNIDIAFRVLTRLINEGYNITPVIKVTEATESLTDRMLAGNPIVIRSYLTEEDLVDLYDSVDIVLIPSGAGSCELPAIEAIARGRIVIASTWPSFTEYVPQAIQVPCARWERERYPPLIECMTCGEVCRVDENVMYEMLKVVVENVEEYRQYFESVSRFVLKRWSWERIVKEELIPVLEARNLLE